MNPTGEKKKKRIKIKTFTPVGCDPPPAGAPRFSAAPLRSRVERTAAGRRQTRAGEAGALGTLMSVVGFLLFWFVLG